MGCEVVIAYRRTFGEARGAAEELVLGEAEGDGVRIVIRASQRGRTKRF